MCCMYSLLFAGLEQGGIEWAYPDLVVKISSTYEDKSLADQVGHIRNISGLVSNIYLPELERVIGLTTEFFEPITPEKGDKVCE